jgi:hypothetical protein
MNDKKTDHLLDLARRTFESSKKLDDLRKGIAVNEMLKICKKGKKHESRTADLPEEKGPDPDSGDTSREGHA